MHMKNYFSFILLLTCFSSCCKNNAERNEPLETVFFNDTYQLTGIAVATSGQMFTNYPRWSDQYRYAVTQINGIQNELPYPDAAMNSWSAGQDGMAKWVCVQSVVRGAGNTLWVVDPASPRMEGVSANSNKLVKLDVASNTVLRTYPVAAAAGAGSYINDVRVDESKGYAYITNSTEGGIVVVNLNTGVVRQVLQNHYSVKSDPAYTFIIDGRELKKNGQVVKINSDGIALSPDGQWLYYKPLTDDKLYRIQAMYLQDETLGAAALESKVQDLGRFCATDGMIFNTNGDLYLGDMQHYRIVKISPDLKMTEVIRDDRLIWPDSYSIHDGYLYVSCSQINKQPEYNEGVNKRTTPYAIYRLKL
jgi:sugar lactone lactonase YvrE